MWRILTLAASCYQAAIQSPEGLTQLLRELRVVAACGDGLYQRAFCARLAEHHRLAGVVLFAPSHAKGSLSARLRRVLSPAAAVRYLRMRWAIRRYERVASPLRRKLFYTDGRPPEIPDGVPVIRVEDV